MPVLLRDLAYPLAGIASLVMVRIILDFHDERHAVLGPPRQAPVTNVRVIKDGVQLTQVTARKPQDTRSPIMVANMSSSPTSPGNARD